MTELCCKCSNVTTPEDSRPWGSSRICLRCKRAYERELYAKQHPVVWQARVDDTGRECTKCRVYKLWAAFYPGSGDHGHSAQCKECLKAAKRARWAANENGIKEREKANFVARKDDYERWYLNRQLAKYGLTVERYEELLAEQGGLCAVCRKVEVKISPAGKVLRFAVDHDHACCAQAGSCGSCVRGLLCASCNTLLGKVEALPESVQSIVAYLAKSGPIRDAGAELATASP